MVNSDQLTVDSALIQGLTSLAGQSQECQSEIQTPQQGIYYVSDNTVSTSHACPVILPPSLETGAITPMLQMKREPLHKSTSLISYHKK